jgi:hypothetical protein
MSFFKRLLGISDSNRGEIFTRISDQTWVSTKGEVINQVSEDVSMSTNGTVYNRIGDSTVVGSDGSVFTSLGDSMSSDGSIRTGNVATGRGAIFSEGGDDW